MPGDRDYERTRISTSRGERYFCTEAEARAAGWRRATQGFPLYFSNCCRFVDFQILPSFEPPSPVGDYCSPSVRLKLCFFDPVSECFENRHHLVDRDSSLRFAFRVVQISRRRVIPSVTFSAVPPMIGAGCCSWCLAECARAISTSRRSSRRSDRVALIGGSFVIRLVYGNSRVRARAVSPTRPTDQVLSGSVAPSSCTSLVPLSTSSRRAAIRSDYRPSVRTATNVRWVRAPGRRVRCSWRSCRRTLACSVLPTRALRAIPAGGVPGEAQLGNHRFPALPAPGRFLR